MKTTQIKFPESFIKIYLSRLERYNRGAGAVIPSASIIYFYPM